MLAQPQERVCAVHAEEHREIVRQQLRLLLSAGISPMVRTHMGTARLRIHLVMQATTYNEYLSYSSPNFEQVMFTKDIKRA